MPESEAVQIALVSAGSGIVLALIALIPSLLGLRKQQRRTDDKIGVLNGHGSMLTMLAEILSRVTRLEEDHQELQAKQQETHRMMEDHITKEQP